jgi:hypothetical protein
MIHRYLHAIFTAGVATILRDISYLDELFADNYQLTETEVEAIKEYFAGHPPMIVNGYARQDNKFPIFAITLGSEGEEIKFLGDDAGLITDPEDEFYKSDLSSAVWEHQYDVLIYTDHPDVTAWYYEIAKYLLLAAFPTLTELGCFGYQVNGADLAPDPKYLPEYLFARRLTLRVQREFQQIDRESRMSKAFKVAGIAIDSAGSSSDVGGVKTNVKPYIR